MPYTPPAAQSPSASRPESPTLSRSQVSTKNSQKTTPGHGSGHDLPHSSSSKSYLSKHRRSPSISKFITEPLTPDDSPEIKNSDSDDDQIKRDSDRSTLDRLAASTDALSSGSPRSSSDEESDERRGRAKSVRDLTELQAAIRIIEQHRSGSPNVHTSEETKKARSTLGLPPPRLDPTAKLSGTEPPLSPRPPLSAGARKISHSRSSTDTSSFFDFARNKFDSQGRSPSESEGDEVEDDDLRIKPSLIRKKSGELVRPALRASRASSRRPSSMPGTPTYCKAVHFQDSSLEHVRHFLQVDRPIAVSAGSSPVDNYDDEIEFPFGHGDSVPSSSPFEWEIRLTNFPRDTIERSDLPVRTEKIYLSPDNKTLIGAVAVKNLAFHKQVVARYTLDFWKTTSEVVAEYDNDLRKKKSNNGCDRFAFNIKLEDQANLENKTMFFCIRYHVNGQMFWDNNSSLNYQVDFSKKFKPQHGKQGMQPKNSRPSNALPRSKPSPSFSPNGRPRSMPSFDDFPGSMAPYDFASFPHPSSMVGDSPILFRNKPSSNDIVPDAPGKPKSSANQQAFGNRYDFGASLSAAIQAASTVLSPTKEETGFSWRGSSIQSTDPGKPPVVKVQPSLDAGRSVNSSEATNPNLPDGPKPVALTAEKPSLQSSSYHELLDKYCFFGSGKPSSPHPQPQPQPQPTKSVPSQLDGNLDELPKPDDSCKELDVAISSPPQITSPAVEERKASNFSSPRASRSASPATGSAMGSRAASPGAFGYPYSQSMQKGLFDSHTPTAIRG